MLSETQSSSLWKAKDYVNFIVKDVARPDLPNQDNVDRRTTPRMPWHDISVAVDGPVARDVARHFIQRYRVLKTLFFGLFQMEHPVYCYMVTKCWSIAQCGNFMIFLLLRFYVKSILGNVEGQNLPFLQIERL